MTHDSNKHDYYAATKKLPDGTMLVVGWYDVTCATDRSICPDPSTLTAISSDDWEKQYGQVPRRPWQIKNGRLVEYAASPITLTLKEQAQDAFQQARQEFSDLQMMGKTFGPQMQSYVRTLQAIINGTDTTSTTLPVAPTDPTA